MQYKDNLIGKHFKALQQLAVFHMDDTMCPKLVQDLWKATGELGAMLWFTEIEDMNQYIVRIDRCCTSRLVDGIDE